MRFCNSSIHNLLNSKFVQNRSDIYDGGDRDLALQFPDLFLNDKMVNFNFVQNNLNLCS